jgi:hypothetical protein
MLLTIGTSTLTRLEMDDGSISIWMMRRASGKVLRIADDTIVETRADGEQDVAMLHGHVGFQGAMHTEHADELLVSRRIPSQTHQGIGDGETKQPREQCHVLRGVAQHHATAGIDHRPLGLQQHLRGFANLPAMSLGHRVIRAHGDLRRIIKSAALLCNVLGYIDHDRARSSGRRDIESLLDRDGKVAYILDQKMCFTHGRGCRPYRTPETRPARWPALAPPGENHHGDGVHVGGGDAGHRVGDAWAAGYQRHADPSGGTGIAVGRMDRALLVPYQDVLKFVLLEDFVVDIEYCAPGIAKYEVDTLFVQAANDDFRAGNFGGSDFSSNVHGTASWVDLGEQKQRA